MIKNLKFDEHMQYNDEAVLLKDAISYLSSLSQTRLLRINDNCHRGYADLIVCFKGHFVAIELKDKTGKPSEHQKYFLDTIIKAQGTAGIAHNLYEIKALLKSVI